MKWPQREIERNGRYLGNNDWEIDKHSNSIAFPICNLQNFRYHLFHLHSRIAGKHLAQNNGIFDLPILSGIPEPDVK
jgi:hypothetical protein